MEYYSAIKKEHIWVSSKNVDETEYIIQSEVSQKEKHQYIDTFLWTLERW